MHNNEPRARCPNAGILRAGHHAEKQPELQVRGRLKHCENDPHVQMAVALLFWRDRKIAKRKWLQRAAQLSLKLGDAWALQLAFELEEGGLSEQRECIVKRKVGNQPALAGHRQARGKLAPRPAEKLRVPSPTSQLTLKALHTAMCAARMRAAPWCQQLRTRPTPKLAAAAARVEVREKATNSTWKSTSRTSSPRSWSGDHAAAAGLVGARGAGGAAEGAQGREAEEAVLYAAAATFQASGGWLFKHAARMGYYKDGGAHAGGRLLGDKKRKRARRGERRRHGHPLSSPAAAPNGRNAGSFWWRRRGSTEELRWGVNDWSGGRHFNNADCRESEHRVSVVFSSPPF